MQKSSLKQGFTLVELLIVMAIASGLLALAAPLFTSLKIEIALKQTVLNTKTEILTGITYALTGKSIAALSENKLEDSTLIPSHYGLEFTTGEDTPIYKLLEFGADKTLYSLEKEWPSPSVFLKTIHLKKTLDDPGKTVSTLLVDFIPPFALIQFKEDPTAHFAELVFGHKDNDTYTSTLLIDTHKTLTVL